MVLVTRIFTSKEKQTITRNSSQVRRRRNKLGIRQKDLDVAAKVSPRTVERIERRGISFRSMPPEHPDIAAVFDTLGRIESGELKIQTTSSAGLVSRRSKPNLSPVDKARKPTVCRATIFRCPEQGTGDGSGVWLTQSACSAMIESNIPICSTRAKGRPCRGVAFRRGLDRKDIEAEYKPPSSPELQCGISIVHSRRIQNG